MNRTDLHRVTSVFLLIVVAFGGTLAAHVTIEKHTNGFDADTAPGPVITVGDPVNWTYRITNTGGRAITNIAVVDDRGVVVSCPATTLDAGTSMTCTGSGTAAAGQYANIGTVTAEDSSGSTISDTDPSHYFGQTAPSVRIEKATNGIDADSAPGPFLGVGNPVNWAYVVTNIGSDPLTNIVVSDDQGVAVSCPATTLAAGDSMTCTGSGTVQSGQYANIGSVTATLPDSSTTFDNDPSHYYGQSISIRKRTNGVEATTPPGPVLALGSAVNWTYEIFNPGPAAVDAISVTDDQGVAVTCPQTTLAAGGSMTCTGSGTATGGQYANTATVTATLPGGSQVSRSAISHYFGYPIAIEKATNGVDADAAPGPAVPIGAPVAWTYVVTNTTTTDTLTGVTVTDNQGVTVTCPSTTLAAGASMTCTGSGTAAAGQYANVGTVNATSATIGAVTASDSSHYFGHPIDFGDAPDPTYPVLLASNAARHVLGSAVYLGSCVDAELDGLQSADATGDDLNSGASAFGTCATIGDDEDGVAFVTPVVITTRASAIVTASAPCTLSAWIDFNDDGDWNDTGEEIFPGGTALTAGANTVTFTVPAGATAGTTISRFRCTTAGAVGVTGEASDGEVEDHAVTLVAPVITISATKTDALQVDVDSDGQAEPGDTLRYTISVTNSGNAPASAVVFTDSPDANTELVVGSVTTTAGTVTTGNTAGDTTVRVEIGTVAPFGGIATIAFDVVVVDPLPLGVASVSNQGRVSGSNFAEVPTDDPDAGGATDPTVTALTVPPSVNATKVDALHVDVDSDGIAEPGDTLRYTITITNAGTGDATSVVFTDTPDSNTDLVIGSVTTSAGTITSGNTAGNTTVGVDLGTIAGLGGTVTISFAVLVDDPLPLGVAAVSNQGVVGGANFANVATDDPDVAGASDPTITPLTVPPSVSATKVDALHVDLDSDGQAEPGDTLRYTITITNAGTGNATSVVFTDTPDSNTDLVIGSVATSAGTITSGNTAGNTTVGVDLGTMAGLGATATITFDVLIDDPLPLGVTSVSNQGVVSGANFGNVPTDDSDAPGAADATVTALTVPPAISATKTVALGNDANGDGVPGAGDTLRYTVVIVNAGTGDATAVVFTDTPDANTPLVVGSVTTTAGTVTTGNTAGDTTVAVDVGIVAGLGGTATIAFEVLIPVTISHTVTQISNVGFASGANFTTVATDDPGAAGASNPTIITLAVVTIPTLQTTILMLLAALLAVAAIHRLHG